jgi:hypothetical protein
MITREDFYKRRDTIYARDLTPEMAEAADITISKANILLGRYPLGAKDRTATSGWRPPSVNAATKGAAKKSNHLLGRAIDINDPAGDLSAWLMTPDGQKALEEIGLWMEHPSATPGWAHVQTVPPKSGKRVFYP